MGESPLQNYQGVRDLVWGRNVLRLENTDIKEGYVHYRSNLFRHLVVQKKVMHEIF